MRARHVATRTTRPGIALALATICILLLTPGCDRKPRPRVRSERIGSVGKDYRRMSLAVSRDHRRLAWVQGRGARCRVFVDGKPGPWFAKCADPQFSPDGKTVLYFAAKENADPPRVQLVVDGVVQPLVVRNDGPLAFQSKGDRWATIVLARPDDASSPRPDPAPSPAPADAAAAPAPSAVPRKMVAFDATRVLGEYADASKPAISSDGAHVAYVVADEKGVQSLVVDGEVVRAFGVPKGSFLPAVKEIKPAPNLEPETTVRYLADGSLAGIALGENGWTVFHDQDVWATYPGLRLPPEAGFEVTQSDLLARAAIYAGSFATAESAPVACWWAKDEGDTDRWRVLCNGKRIDDNVCDPPLPGIAMSVSADGRSVLYPCKITPPLTPGAQPEPRTVWVIAGGKKQGPHQFVWGLELAADGKHWAYAAADTVSDPWFYVVDGKRFDGPWQHTFPAKFGADGTPVVWAASPDEKGRRVDLVENGRVRARAEIVMAPPLFRDDGAVQWAVKRGHGVRRVIFD